MKHTSGSWDHVTKKAYNSDDSRYRDVNSNSSGGSGTVTGRITGIAADDQGYVYAGGANGGVFRSTTGGGHWKPIADKLPSLSTGTLSLDGQKRLWYATGESNTGRRPLWARARLRRERARRPLPWSVRVASWRTNRLRRVNSTGLR